MGIPMVRLSALMFSGLLPPSMLLLRLLKLLSRSRLDATEILSLSLLTDEVVGLVGLYFIMLLVEQRIH